MGAAQSCTAGIARALSNKAMSRRTSSATASRSRTNSAIACASALTGSIHGPKALREKRSSGKASERRDVSSSSSCRMRSGSEGFLSRRRCAQPRTCVSKRHWRYSDHDKYEIGPMGSPKNRKAAGPEIASLLSADREFRRPAPAPIACSNDASHSVVRLSCNHGASTTSYWSRSIWLAAYRQLGFKRLLPLCRP